jgi:cyclic pyranopterin phosphate synthase
MKELQQNLQQKNMTDTLGRPLHDLRLSVTDRCNFRCTYCMPQDHEDHKPQFLPMGKWLSFAEILCLVGVLSRLGVKKIRITGGEPLLRPGLPDLIHELAAIPMIDDIALTTNGVLLPQWATALKSAGLQRLTVSLDTLDALIFHQFSGNRGNVNDVLKGIKAAEAAGFTQIKINVVVQKGVNDHTLMDLVEYFRGTGHIVRFIEFMDVGTCNHWQKEAVISNVQILKEIHQRYPLMAVDASYYGEVASRYRYVDGQGEIGFISSVTQPFCQSCTRLRISPDGKLYTCLFNGKGIDLQTPLRAGASPKDLEGIIRDVWTRRNDRYSENRFLYRSLQKDLPKVEMYQIGG